MLLDILNMSSTLANIIRSVTDNLLALGLVLYLIICAVLTKSHVHTFYPIQYAQYST